VVKARDTISWKSCGQVYTARRGEARGDSESRQTLEGAIDVGMGGVHLRLTLEQYRKLRRPP
jgi:hypothetical protein